MTKRLVAIGYAAALILALRTPTPTVAAQTVAQAAGAVQPAAPPTAPAASPQRALVDRYCVACHNQRGKAAGQEPARKITLDDLDIAHVTDHADAWER